MPKSKHYIQGATYFKCPLCAQVLSLNEHSLRCANKHCFDIAKEGYANLLPVQNKKSLAPGDNAEMIACRRRFLQTGLYGNFINKINRALAEHSTSGKRILDIGCGEGHYLEALLKADNELEAYALDISKPAVKLAAKNALFSRKSDAGQEIRCTVGSAFDLPFFDSEFNIALSVFSPLSAEETFRVLAPEGIVIVAGPAPKHLKELAEIVYNKAQSHEGNPEALLPESHFEKLQSLRHEEIIEVEGSNIIDLLTMTPYYWSCSEDAKTRLSELAVLKTHIEFDIHVFKKKKPNPEI